MYTWVDMCMDFKFDKAENEQIRSFTATKKWCKKKMGTGHGHQVPGVS